MATRRPEPFRMKKARKSTQKVYYLDRSGNRQIASANQFDELRRPSKDITYHCLGCDAPMRWNKGPKKPNQPDNLFSQTVRSKSFFYHMSGTLDDHINTQADNISFDLAKAIEEHAKERGWEVEIAGLEKTAGWTVTITNGERKIPFVICPRNNQKITNDPNTVVVTATDRMFADRQRVILYDDDYNPLSSQQVKDTIGQEGTDKFWISGFFERGPSLQEQENGKAQFIPRQIPLFYGIDQIMEGKMVFVDNVDGLAYEDFPTSARFGLVEADAVRAVDKLKPVSASRVRKTQIAAQISEALSISTHSDVSRVGTTGRYKYGGAEVLYVFHGMENNPEGLWSEGSRKVVINPSPRTLMRKMQREDWQNTMVIFIQKDQDRRDFNSIAQIMVRRNTDPEFDFHVRSVYSVKKAIEQAREFLSAEIERRDRPKLTEPAPFSIERFIEHETGGTVQQERLPFPQAG